MIKTKTVLVLGAGASAPYGYPVGRRLRESILKLSSSEGATLAKLAGLRANYSKSRGDALDVFVKAFRQSQNESIDAFLAHRSEFENIGKRAIAAVLLEVENWDSLFRYEPEDHWYQYLLRYIAEEPWSEVDLSNLAIVTFNYDRSLEHYLLGVFIERSAKSREEVADKLRQLEIVHVYGSLGSPLPETEDPFDKFGGGVSEERVLHAAECIRVIPEGRNEDESLVKARSLLEGADRIAFLGFGFDKINLLRLDAEKTCKMRVERGGGILQRTIMATCFGLTNAERKAAFRSTAGLVSTEDIIDLLFFNANCTAMLRETLFFEPN